MCEICHQTPCASRCPGADGPELFGRCIDCKAKIYEGDDCYIIDGVLFCEECIRKYRKIAGEE